MYRSSDQHPADLAPKTALPDYCSILESLACNGCCWKCSWIRENSAGGAKKRLNSCEFSYDSAANHARGTQVEMLESGPKG